MGELTARIDTSGRLIVPAALRKSLGLTPGAIVTLRVVDRELRVLARSEAVRLAQERVRRYVKPGRRIAEELIAERSAERRHGLGRPRRLRDPRPPERRARGPAVVEALDESVISAVNLSEVVAKLLETGMPHEEAEDTLGGLGLEVHPFDEAAAWSAGGLRSGTREAGLSLGDRACPALAKQLGLPALTADSARATASAGVDVRLLR